MELDALERTKDEEMKRFQAQKINFDFGILVRIKEVMVDVSSNCMELALKVGFPRLIKSHSFIFYIYKLLLNLPTFYNSGEEASRG